MPSNLPQRSGPPAGPHDAGQRRSGTNFAYEIRSERKLGGVAAALLGVLLLGAVLAFLILGVITITIVLWLAFGLLLLSIIAAVFRRVLGLGRGSAPGPDRR